MLAITKIFSHHITQKTNAANHAVNTAVDCGRDYFCHEKSVNIEKISAWWNSLLDFLRQNIVLKNNDSFSECQMVWFKESHSWEEFQIAQRRGLFKVNPFFPERRLNIDAIDALTALSDERFLNFKKRDLYSFVIPQNGNWRVCDVRCLAQLSDEDFANIAKRGLCSENFPLKKYIRDPYDLAELAELSDKAFANIEDRKLLNPNLYKNMCGKLSGMEIAMLAKLSDKVFANIGRRNLASAKYYGFNGNFDIWQIAELAKLSDDAFLNIEKRGLMNEDFAAEHGICLGRDIKALAELTEEKFEFAKEFLKKCFWKKYPFSVAKILNELPKEKIEKLQKICSNDGIVNLFSDEHGMKLLRKLGIIDLIIEKKVDIDTVNSIAEAIKGKRSKLSSEIFSDIKLLSKSKSKSVVVEFIKGTDKKSAFNSSKVGDVVQIGDKMFINDGNNLVPWQMDRKTFDKLFPPVDRFMIKQKTQDCYLLSAIFDCLRNPTSRAEIYKSFKLNGDDIICTIKAYKDFAGSVRFKKGQLPYGFSYADASDGVKMLEYAYAKTSIRHTPIKIYPYLNSNPSSHSLVKRITGGEASDAYHELLGIKNFDYVIKMPQINKKTGVNEVECLIGVQHAILPTGEKFAMHNTHLHSEKHWQKILDKYANKENYLLAFSTFVDANDRRFGIIPTHVYSIIGYNSTKKTVSFVNPHNTAETVEMPLSALSIYSGKLSIAKIK